MREQKRKGMMMKHPFFMADGHVHFDHGSDLPFLKDYLSLGFRNLNLVALPGTDGYAQTQNMVGALLKLECPSLFCSAALAYEKFPVRAPLSPEYAFEKQAEELAQIGFDGMKMLEGKPGTRKSCGISPADELYEAYFDYLERNRIHIVWHVNDPEEFWTDRAPAFAKESHWTYEDGTYLTYQQHYDEVYEVLDRHPMLNATFAHFFFHSEHPDETVRLFEKYPGIGFDITPGREMYGNFSRNPAVWKQIFTKYADRICFGSDMDTSEFQGNGRDVTGTVWRFLTTEDHFRFWDLDIIGLGLDDRTCDLIGGETFYHRIGRRDPKPIDCKKLAAYIDRWLPLVTNPQDREYISSRRKML